MEYEKLKLSLKSTSLGDVKFYTVPNVKKIKITLRGQPTPKSPFTVLRSTLSNTKWDINSPYMSGDIINNSDDFDTILEGTVTAKELHLHSKSLGWICIEISNNQFIDSNFTKRINDGRYPKFNNNDVCLKVPKDIDKVFAI